MNPQLLSFPIIFLMGDTGSLVAVEKGEESRREIKVFDPQNRRVCQAVSWLFQCPSVVFRLPLSSLLFSSSFSLFFLSYSSFSSFSFFFAVFLLLFYFAVSSLLFSSSFFFLFFLRFSSFPSFTFFFVFFISYLFRFFYFFFFFISRFPFLLLLASITIS